MILSKFMWFDTREKLTRKAPSPIKSANECGLHVGGENKWGGVGGGKHAKTIIAYHDCSIIVCGRSDANIYI